jgi:hypothetical protein
MTGPFVCAAARRFALLSAVFALVLGVSAPAMAQEGLHLLFSDRPNGYGLRPDLTLRPNLLQPVYVYVQNNKLTAEDFCVELRAHGAPAEGTTVRGRVEAGKTVRLLFGGSESPDAKEVTLLPLTGATEVRLSSGAAVLQEVKLSVARPAEYVRVVGIEFDPRERAGVKNRLSVKLEAAAGFSGPRCKAELMLHADRVPGLLTDGTPSPSGGPSGSAGGHREGRYAGYLNHAGDVLTLEAENLAFSPVGTSGLVSVNIDGYPRAFTYVVPFGGDVPCSGQEVRQPLLGILAPAMAASTGTYHVGVELDNVPAHSVAELCLTHPGDEGDEADSEVLKFSGSRRERLLFGVDGRHATLLFRPAVTDWAGDLDVGEVSGKRTLRLRLRDAVTGAPVPALDSGHIRDWKDGADNTVPAARLPVVLDLTPPEHVRFLAFPGQLPGSMLLPVRATADDPESGVRQAVFFAGKPTADGRVPPGAVAAEGKLDPATHAWAADLPMTAAQSNPFELSVRFTNGAGLTATETIRIQIVDPARKFAGPLGVAPIAKPGSIQGTVLQGPLPQPGLAVRLVDETNNVRATTVTDAAGNFTFSEVAPGAYRVAADRPMARTRGETPVSVGAGQKRIGTDIKLYR